jgi:hypothetical protein
MAVRVVGLSGWVRHLDTLEERAGKEFPRVVERGALNVKEGWRAGWEAIKNEPTHIPHIVRGIGYDTDHRPPTWAASIGVLARNRQSFLAHILEYGTVNSPPYPAGQTALDAEAPLFERAAAEVAEKLLEG